MVGAKTNLGLIPVQLILEHIKRPQNSKAQSFDFWTNIVIIGIIIHNVIVTPCSVSLATRLSPYTKGYLTQHWKPPRF